LSVSKIAIRLLLNSFLLGPLSIVFALIVEAILATHQSILFNENSTALLIILFGGFLSSFACMGASMLILLPMAIYEFSSGFQDKSRSGILIVKKYLPVLVLLSVVLGLTIWLAGEFKPISHELVAIIISFYLTATTGLYLMGRQLTKPQA
jgi:hypothetical protein